LLLDKGIRDFLKSARIIRAKYPEVKFDVVGPIDSGNPMAISSQELNTYTSDNTVTYHGAVTDVRPFIQRADALVLPTYYGEGLSRVCLESLSMGIPVIATDNRGCKQIVIDGITGLTIPQKNLELLPDAIEKFLLLGIKERAQMGENGRNLVMNNFSIEKVIQFYETIISTICKSSDAVNGMIEVNGKITAETQIGSK